MIDAIKREEYLTRRFARLVAIGGLCIGAIWVLELVVRPTQAVWWSVTGHITLFFVLFVIAVGASVMDVRILRTLMWLSTALGFVLQLLTFLAMRGPVTPGVWEFSWLLTGIYLCFIALLVRTKRPHLTINVVAAGVATFPALSYWWTHATWPIDLWVVTLIQFTNVGFPMLLLELRSRMAQFGARQDRWRMRAAESAATRDRLREERRLGSVLHDKALGVMSQIMWSGGEITDDLRASVRNALTLLQEAEKHDDREIAVREIRAAIEATLAETHSDVDFTITTTGGSLHESVIATVTASLMEALRNSLKHAPGAHRSISAELGGESVRVVVSDNGPGFALETIGAGRLGVSGSITARMRDLPGGSSEIVSAPGEGTVVTLSWQRQ